MGPLSKRDGDPRLGVTGVFPPALEIDLSNKIMFNTVER